MNNELTPAAVSPDTANARSVLILHHHALLSEGIARIIRDAGFRVIQEIETAKVLESRAMAETPDIIIIDYEMEESENAIIRALRKRVPGAVIIVLTTPRPGQSFVPAMSAGAQGYLSVNLPAEIFINLLHLLAGGNIVIAREKISDDADNAHINSIFACEQLSRREKEVLGLVGKGATNREIAGDLFISENTVKVHLRAILNKLNLRNRQQAAAYATQIGLVSEFMGSTRLQSPQNEPCVRIQDHVSIGARN